MSEVTRLEKVQPVSVTVYTGATAAKAQFAHTFRKRRRLSAFQRNCIAYQQEWKCAMCRNLLPRIGAVGPVLKRCLSLLMAAQEPRKSTKSDAPTAPTTAARRVDARRNSSRGSAPSGRS